MSCKVIAIENQKGGTGKSTTALNLGVGLHNAGKKVLLMHPYRHCAQTFHDSPMRQDYCSGRRKNHRGRYI